MVATRVIGNHVIKSLWRIKTSIAVTVSPVFRCSNIMLPIATCNTSSLRMPSLRTPPINHIFFHTKVKFAGI